MKLVDIKNLTFEYFRRDGDGNVEETIEAVSKVDLDVNHGEFIAIVGANGSGKSTLAKQINGLLIPEEGTIIVDGMDVTDSECILSIRKAVGMVFQNPDNQFVTNVVEEDVAFGPENLGVKSEWIRERVRKSLRRVRMDSDCRKSPNQLSGGQKQRVAIAGVLAMEPKCILFDEATTMLEPEGRKNVMKIAKELQTEKSISIIWITHHMDEVLLADRVFVMNQGKIICRGTPKEVFAQEELLEQCGLKLPSFNQYITFLVSQGMMTKLEAESVHQVRDVVKILVQRYSGGIKYINNINDLDFVNNLVSENDTGDLQGAGDIEDNRQRISLKDGIYLNRVGYVYNKGFSNEKYALKNVNLSVAPGEFLAIIGCTGSGKTTLLQHLNGLYLPTEGNVYYKGNDISDVDFSLKTLRQKVGMVFQYPEYQLFADSVEKDVCFGPLNMNLSHLEAQKRAYEAIRLVGLPDTIYDSSPFQLSGGQKRRVAIAGVLAMQPDFLVLDEPTAGLDPMASEELLNMLKSLQQEKGIGIVIVTHSMEMVAEYADRVVVLKDGTICLEGTTDEVFSQENQLRQMGLDIPVGNELLRSLRRSGFDVDDSRYKWLEVCDEILGIKDSGCLD